MQELARDVFVEESTVRFYGFRLQTRMAAVRLPGSRLFLYSPVPLTSGLRRELGALGEVAFLVSPNKIHNQTLAAYRAAFPEAKLFVPPGLPERLPALAFDEVLGDAPVGAWSPDLEHVLTRGNVFFCEALFFHGASRTLLVGDFVEKIGPGVASPVARAAARVFGVRPEPMASPEFRWYTTDADALEESLSRVLAWPIQRVFLCHGDLVEEGGREVVERVADSLLREVRGRSAMVRALFERFASMQ